jgi:fibronectin-binding autotransporter adhesin
MNSAYKTIWNAAIGAWVAVSETTRARGKRSTSQRAGRATRLVGLTRIGMLPALGVFGALQLAGGAAWAACTPAAPGDGAFVSCTGAPILLPPNPNSFLSNANGLNVTVQAGTVMSTLPGGTALNLGGTGITLTNLGAIDANAAGSLVLARALSIGNLIAPGSGALAVNNQGSIEGTYNGTFGLSGIAMLIANAGQSTITNAGTIGLAAQGAFDPINGIAVGIYGGGNVNFTNTGTITGRVAFQSPTAGGNRFVNAGTINGSVALGSGERDDTFIAVTGSSINGGLGPLPGVTVPTAANSLLAYAAAGTVDAGVGGTDTLVLQNTVSSPGSGSGGSGTISSTQYLNFENLLVNSGTWTLQGPVVSGSAVLNGGIAIFDSALSFGTGTLTGSGGAMQASVDGLALAQNVNLTSGLIVQGANSFTLGGTVSGGAGLIKNGTGTLTLNGVNTFSGGFALNGGGLTLGNASALGSGLFLVGGNVALNTFFTGTLNNQVQLSGALTLDGTGTLTFGAPISGAGSLRSNGNLALAASNTYGGGTTMGGGRLDVGSNTALGTGDLTIDGASVLTGAAGVTLANNVVLNNTLNFGAAGSGGALTLNGTISGAGGISLAGAPGVTLNGANTFTGGFNLGAGTLTVGNDTALGQAGVTVSGPSSLEANKAVSLANDFRLNAALTVGGANDLALNGAITGLRALTKNGTGRLTLGGANNFSGGVNLQSGALRVGTDTALGGGDLTVSGTAALDASAAVNLANDVVLNANLNVDGANDIALGGQITGTGGIIYSGTGTLTLGKANGFTGGTTLNSGTLSLGDGLALGGGKLSVAGNANLRSGVANIGVNNGVTLGAGATLGVDGSNPLTLTGTIDGDGALALSGTGAVGLTGANTYGGGTTVTGTTLIVANTSGSATGSGAVQVQGGGTLGGSGSIAGTVNVGEGILSPGAGGAGTLTVGGLNLAAGSTLNYELGQAGVAGGAFNDLISVNGNLQLDGTLNVTQSQGGKFGAGLYRLIDYTGSLTDNGLEIGTAPTDAKNLQVQTSVANQVNLVNSDGVTLTLWDGADPANFNDGKIAGGSGTWRAGGSTSSWTGVDGALNAGWQQDGVAIFSGQAGIVTVDTQGGAKPVGIGGAQFAVDGYTVNGDALTITAPQTVVRVGDGTAAGAGMTATIASEIAGAGGLVKDDLGTLVLDGSNSYSGGTTVKGGILQIASDANLGAVGGGLALEGATLHVTGDTASKRAVSLGTGVNSFDIDQTVALDGTVSGAGSLRKIGTGTLQLGAANAYVGGTDVAAGAVEALVTGALGSGPVSVADNASLAFTNTAEAGALAITVAARGGAPGDNGGFVAFRDSSSAGDASITTNQGASVEFRDASSAGNAVIENRGGSTTLWFNANGGKAQITNFAGGLVNLLDDASAGQARLVNGNGGVIDIADRASADQATVVNDAGALLRISKLTTAGVGIGSLEGAGDVQLGAKALTTGGLNTSTTLSGTISGNGGSVVKVGGGTLGLNGANTYTGGTTVAGGTLAANNTSGSATGIGGVQVQSGATLAGTGSIAGAVTVADGGVLSAGNGGVGTLTLGGLNLAAGSVLNYDLGQAGVAGGALNDLISVNGNLQLDGTLNVAQSAGGKFGAGLYRLIDYTGTLTDNGLEIGTAPTDAKNLQVQTAVANQVNLVNSEGVTLTLWDGSTPANFNDGKVAGGSGTWRAGGSSSSWTGIDGKLNGGWQQDGVAVFSGQAGTVTVDTQVGANPVRLGGAQFAVSGYTINGDALTITAPQTVVRVGDGTNAGAGMTATIASALTGTGGLVKEDLGTLVLDSVNSYSGGTTIKGGVLQIASDGNLGAETGGLALEDGATLHVTGGASGTRAVSLGAGVATFEVVPVETLSLGGKVSGAGRLRKTGAGLLQLIAANDYTGGTEIAQGRINATGTGALGSGPVSVAGNAMLVFANTAEAGKLAITAAASGGAPADKGGFVQFINGSSAGEATLVANQGASIEFRNTSSAGKAVIENRGGSTDFRLNASAGQAQITNLAGGRIRLFDDASAGQARLVNESGGLIDFFDRASADQATVVNNAGAKLDIGSLVNAGTSVGALDGAGDVLLGGKALTTGGLNTSTTLSGTISGTGGSVVKVGSGTLALTGANSYTGGTTVAAGTLAANNASGSATGTGAVQVQGGATLAGTGSIAGAVTVAKGGTLSAGNGGVGTLSVGALSLDAGSTLNYELGQAGVAGGTLNDLINVNGNLQLDGTLNVAESAGGKFGAGLYRLINYTGTLTDNGLDIGTAPTGKLSVQTSVANQVNLLNSDGLVLNLWDGGNSANFNDGKIAGGAGTWRAGAPGDNWTDANGLANGTWVQDGFAIFGGQAGTVTVDNKGAGGAVRLGGAQFAVDGYTINGDPLTITAPQTVVRVGDGSSASAGMTATIAASIGGAGGLVKDDGGTLVLTGNNSYAGGTTVKGGILQISADNNLGAFGKGLALDGGTLRIATGSAPFFASRALALGAGGGTIDLGNSVFGVGGLISGNGLLTVTGKGGTLGLVTANSYSGGTLLQDGASITTTASSVLGSGAVRQQGNGTTLLYTDKASAGGNDYTVGRAASADSGNMLAFAQNATAASSKITLNGAGWQTAGVNSVQFSGNTSAGTSTIANAGGSVYFFQDASAGSATIANGGKSQLSFGGNATAGGAQIGNASGGLVRFADNSSGTGATVANAAGGVVDVSGSTAKTGVELGSLSGAGAVVLGATRLTVGGLNTSDTLSGTVSDKGSVFAQPGSGTGGSIVKVGAGTLTLSGANSYTGGTTVAAGTLAVNNASGSATGTGAVQILGGAVLSGSGSIAGAVSIAKGGALSAGNGGPGTLTLGSLSLADGAALNYQLGQANTVGGPLNDLVNVNGNLQLDGTLNVAQSAGGSFGAGLYRLISYTGSLTDNGLDIGTAPGAKTDLQVQTSVAQQVNLINRAGLSLNFWDGGDASKYNDGLVAGGSGTWRVGIPGDGWTGVDGKINAAWAQGQFAVFGGTAGTVTVNDAGGTVRITGAQFATDGYRVQGDAIELGNAATTVRVGDGTAAGAGMTATIASSLTGTGGLVKEDQGTLVLDGSNSYSGGTTVKGGILQIASDANLGAATGGLALEGTTLHVTGDTTGTRAVSLGAGVNSFDIDRTVALNGIVSGAGSLRKIGAGILQLGAANAYVGGTDVAAGAVEALVTGALGSGPVSVADNASLAFANTAEAGALAITVAARGGAPGDNGGFVAFRDSSSAGDASITTNQGASVEFRDSSSAGNAVIENRGGSTTLWFNANGGKAQITNFAGGLVNLLDDASAGQARLVNGNGGVIDIADRASADQATVVNNAGALLRISKLTTAGVGIGSLEGAGDVQLGAKALTTGGLNTSTTLSGTISGNGGSVVKVGSGTLGLSGANTYTGGTTVAGGTLAVNNTSGSATGTGAVQVQGGATLAGNGSVAGAVSIAKGGVLSAGNAGVGTLTLGGLNLADGAVLNYDLGQANTVGGVLNDRVQVNGNLQLDGTLNVAQSKGGVFGAGIYRLIDYTGSLTDNGLDIGSAPIAAKDLQVQTSVAQQVNLVNRTGLSLNFWDGGDNTKYNDGKIAGGSGTWRVGVPGDGWTGADGKINAAWAQDQFAVFGGTGGTVTVSNAGGTVRINGAQFAADGYVLQGDAIELGASGTVVRVGDGSGTDVDRTATVNVALTGAGGLVKDDVGRLVLGGTNTYTGGTTVKAGVLQGNTASLQGGIVNDAEVVFDQAKTGSYAGTMSGTGKLRKIGTGTLTLTSANSYAGGTFVDAGTLATDITGALGSGAASVASGGTLQLGGSFDAGTTAIGNQGTVRFQGKANAGTSTITNAAGGVLAFADDASADKATVLNQAGAQVRIDQATTGVSFGSIGGAGDLVLGAKALTLGASGDNATLSGTISGTGGSVVKVGSGTLTLTGANTYTGGTTVGAGTLSVNNKSGSATGTGAVQIQSGATLAGSGSIAGAVTVDKGGILAAGNSPGTLTLGALTLAGGSTLNYELGQAGVPGGPLNDLINVTGNLNLDGTLNIAQSAGGSFGPGLYRLMSYGGSFTDNGLDIGTVPGSAKTVDLQVQTSVANQVNLVNRAGLSLNFWDGGDSTKYNDGQVAGGSGTWRVGNPQPSMDGWTDMDGKLNANWAQNQFAVFGGKAGTVTVDAVGGAVRIAGAQFATDGYVVQGDGIVVDNANSVIRVGDGTAAGAAMAATLNVALSGTGGISKEDAGRLILGGTNTYTGGTTVKGGVLQGSATSLQGNIVNNAEVAFDQGKTAGTYAGAMSGTGKLRKIGAGTLTLSSANSYSGGTLVDAGTLTTDTTGALGTGPASIASGATLQFGGKADAGKLAIANAGTLRLQDTASAAGATVTNAAGGQVRIDLTTTGTSIGSLSGAGDVVLGAKTLTTGAIGGDNTISGAITGTTGSLVKVGTGTLTLSGTATYAGETRVTGGTLKAGATNAFSAVSSAVVASGATLDLGGFSQKMAGLTNAGTVSLLGTVPGTTLTLTGPYVGNNGVLRLGAKLDNPGIADRLVLDGASASASGKTTVQVTNLGGLGARTSGAGIELISAKNGATTTAQSSKDAFVLSGGRVDAGAYEYRLYAGDAGGEGENWYLRTEAEPGASLPTYRAEASLFAALPNQLRQSNLGMLASLSQRIGDDDVRGSGGASTSIDGGNRRAWGRLISTDMDIRQGGTVSPHAEGRVSGLQAGTDLWANANWRAGIYVGQLEGDTRVSGFSSGLLNGAAGRNDLRSQYLGLYGTFTSDDGFYADAVLQAGRHRYTVQPQLSAGVTGKGNSFLASIEVGKAFALGSGGWSVEPQLQLIHQRLRLDDVAIPGALVQQDADSSWTARAGVRIKGSFATGAGTLQPYARLNVYRSSKGNDVARFVNPAAITPVGAPIGGTSTELAAGFTLALSQRTSLYGELGKQWASGGAARVGSSVNAGVGVRVKW